MILDNIQAQYEEQLRQFDERQKSMPSRFSENNPYYTQMAYETKRRKLEALRKSAIEWEASQANYQQQFDDQLAISDPSFVISRQRAAGINPDLQGSSGTSAAQGAGASVPQMQPTDIDNWPDPLDTVNTVLSAAQTVTSVFTGITGGINSILDFIRSSKDLGNYLTSSAANASLLSTQADIAEQTKAQQIAALNAKNRVTSETADAQIAATNAQNNATAQTAPASVPAIKAGYIAQHAANRYALFEQIFQALPKGTDAQIIRELQNVGLSADELPAYKDYVGSDQRQQLLADAHFENLMSQARNEAMPYQFMVDFAAQQNKIAKIRQGAELIYAQFQEIYNEDFYTPSNASQSALISSAGLDLEQQNLAFDAKKLERNVKAFTYSLDMVKDEIKRSNDRIESIKTRLYKGYFKQAKGDGTSTGYNKRRTTWVAPKPNDPELLAQLRQEYLYQAQLNSTGEDICQRWVSHAQQQYQRVYLNDVLVDDTDDLNTPYWKDRYFAFSEINFSNYVAGHWDSNKVTETLIDIGKSFYRPGIRQTITNIKQP